MGRKAGPVGEIPRDGGDMDIISQVWEGGGVERLKTSSKTIRVRKAYLVKAVFSKEAEADVVARESAMVSMELVSRRSRLRANVLKSDKRRIGSQARREGMTKGFTVRGSKRYT